MKYLFTAFLALLLTNTCWGSQLNVVVVLDGSGSMGDRFTKSNERIKKIEAAKKSLIELLGKLPPNTNVGIICFSGNVNGWLYPLKTIDKDLLNEKIQSVIVGGSTPLGKYMKQGANALLELRAKQKSGTYKLIIITDGEADDDINTPLVGQYGILSKGLQVEAIGVDMSDRCALAKKVPYRSVENFEQLNTAIKDVLAESTGKNDHSEDYEVIAAIPPEVASSALEALSEFDNTPVGVKPVGATINVPSSSGWTVFWWVLGIIGVSLFAIIVIITVTNTERC